MIMTTGIYKVTSKAEPEKFYVLRAMDIVMVWGINSRALIEGRHPNKRLQEHCDKYGIQDLDYSLLFPCPKIDLGIREQHFINKMKPYFNGTDTVEAPKKRTRTKKTKE